MWGETEGQNHLLPNLMASFCARALQRDVLPVPGGPCSRTVRLKDTRWGLTFCWPKWRLVHAYCSSRCLMPCRAVHPIYKTCPGWNGHSEK